MMLAVDRNTPEFREAMDRAAVVAEWLLNHHNGAAEQELALDVLNDYVAGWQTGFWGGLSGMRGHEPSLAWAFALTERRTDLAPHEEKLLELAWEKVKEDAVQREWEEMGL